MDKPTCILLTTANEVYSEPAEMFARQCFDVRVVSRHSWANTQLTGEVLSAMEAGEIDFLFSFLCPVIVPGRVLQMTRRRNINVHPAPPEYPGVGAASRALYDRRTDYGVTAHVMDAKPDTGSILRTRRFAIHDVDTCETLDRRARMTALALFEEVMADCARGGELQASGEDWSGQAMTRKKFREWMLLAPDATKEEAERKIRALRHRTLAGPFVIVHGHRFGFRDEYNR